MERKEIEEGTFEKERHDDILATGSNSSPFPLQYLLSFPYLLFSFIGILSFPFSVFFPLIYLFEERQVEQEREREREGDPPTTGSSMLIQPNQYYFDSYKKGDGYHRHHHQLHIDPVSFSSLVPFLFHSFIISFSLSFSPFLSLNVCRRLD